MACQACPVCLLGGRLQANALSLRTDRLWSGSDWRCLAGLLRPYPCKDGVLGLLLLLQPGGLHVSVAVGHPAILVEATSVEHTIPIKPVWQHFGQRCALKLRCIRVAALLDTAETYQ